MPINKFLYFGDFFAIPVAVAVLAYFALAARGLRGSPDFGVSLLIGLASWTLAEYAIHRFVYHHVPVFSALHDSHHQAPNEFIGVPSFVSSGFIIVVCYFPVRIFDAVAASGFTSGVLLGYAAYMLVHHATHHFAIQPGDWLYAPRVLPYGASLPRQRQFRGQHRLLGPGFWHHRRKSGPFRAHLRPASGNKLTFARVSRQQSCRSVAGREDP
jgi:hypothetical protein